MASFLRSRQAGMNVDLSVKIEPQHFSPAEQARYGINSQISCVAYDPVQSLIAVGTNESKFGNGKIYIFGQSRVQKCISPNKQASIRFLHFVADRLVSLDSRSELSIWDLDTAQRLGGYGNAGAVACMVTDPMLDWVLMGTTSGDVFAFDLDRSRLSNFRLPNFWKQRDPRVRAPNMVSMQLHPRDIGKLLIAYNSGAVIYSFKQNQPTRFFEYVLQPGAPGGTGDKVNTVRTPRVIQAVWHPTGTFVLTAHDDGSLVFWDAKDGRMIAARSLSEINVDQPTAEPPRPVLLEPFTHIAWCCKNDPDDTGLLIAGGLPVGSTEKGLTFLELGPTPIYATSSWEVLSNHFKGKRQHLLRAPLGADITEFYLLPRSSPHFAGAQDPIAVIALLNSGEMITMSFPSGYPISPTNQLHPSLTFVHPFVMKVAVTTVSRERWLGMIEVRNQGEPLLKGGALARRLRRRHDSRNIIQVAHADGTVRLWDVGHGDDIENAGMLQVDVARSTGRYEDLEITALSMASHTGEFAAGTKTGEVAIYRWGTNKHFQHDSETDIKSNPGGLTDISIRSEPSLREGLQPLILYEMMQGPITALQVSNVGFVAVGSENGFFSIIDLRGPAIIMQASIAEFTKQEKRSSFLRGHSSGSSGKDWPVVIEFGVMTLEDDNYSSIACFVGTNQGKVATFKLIPSGGGYSAKLAGVVNCGDQIISISPIMTETGAPAAATREIVAGLREGKQVNGTLVVATQTEIRIFKPATAKGASKSFDNVFCDAAAVTEFELHGHAIVGVFGDCTARAFSIPGLKEISKASLNGTMDPGRSGGSLVTPTGDIFCWAGPSELVAVPVWGGGTGVSNSDDTMINPAMKVPPRPTISNMQWISGTQHVSPTDLDELIGGPDRPPSKRMIAAAAEEQRLARGGGVSSSSTAMRAGATQEGWGEYLTRQLNERTEKLNIVNDSMDNLQTKSQGWADDVNKYVSKQKKNLVLGAIKGKFS
ncbi:hypothetical protein MCOR30_001597 [Pyricularia oryzae]|nr:hypothetical protein MCOR30_001597 [Pyricularia oryzae]